jgi:inosose dehydratase
VWFPEDDRQPHWSRFLDEAAQAGYSVVELGPWGYLPTDPDLLARELEQRGLRLCGATCIAPLEDESHWSQLEQEVRAAATLAHRFEIEHLVLIDSPYSDLLTGEVLAPKELDPEAWSRLVATTTRVGESVRDEWGLQLVFHPHAETHVETEAQIERLLEDTPADAVALCLDTGHHAYCDGEPVSFIRRHSARIPYLHLKDVDRQLRRRVLDESILFGDAVAQGVFVEPGRGTIDFTELRRVLDEIGYNGWAVVEQDMYPAPLDAPLPIARRTREHLVGAGFAT